MKSWLKCLPFVTSALLLAAALPAQAQTSVGVSALGAFPSSTSSNMTEQNPYKQAGFMVELRHISNPLVGFDVSYAFHRANQSYRAHVVCPTSALPCSEPTASVSANANELALNWVVSAPILGFRIFALAGGGFESFNPTGSNGVSTQSQTKGLYDYGAGVDWTVLPHLGLRFQYRGNVYKAPDLATAFSSTDKFTHDAEPMIGAYFNF
ncbi:MULTISPECIES: outer membrane beta-barrel protein [Acidobacterium]|uniref:Outer membrane protein beta-barrel domain-containing protein n=1 Tax=Acidobacterium capsulatum (strain ATCC 51196 / DSM 11244 / BCRC 80197 / JCM 7670 / NBRC 15755 / NCIMB 13165 / 161) TaxID=240015 RepID=C1F9X6_ACIC5|nr:MULTISPECIES: outer membrane beta-barrel protein [Acidobacterium]ACO34522.1 hypothetical protein ACP_0353 [Acidobacterium capsulatum ATCC 51196]HCT62101.1 hypothetical protein [Acidobacterium sp.]